MLSTNLANILRKLQALETRLHLIVVQDTIENCLPKKRGIALGDREKEEFY